MSVKTKRKGYICFKMNVCTPFFEICLSDAHIYTNSINIIIVNAVRAYI